MYAPPGIAGDYTGCVGGGQLSGCPINASVYNNASITVFGACTVDGLQVRNYTGDTADKFTATLYHSGVSTSLTCGTPTGALTPCSDTSHTVSLAAGDTIALYLQTTNTGGFITAYGGGGDDGSVPGPLYIQLHCK